MLTIFDRAKKAHGTSSMGLIYILSRLLRCNKYVSSQEAYNLISVQSGFGAKSDQAFFFFFAVVMVVVTPALTALLAAFNRLVRRLRLREAAFL